MEPHRQHQTADTVLREGHDWVEKLTSGEATLDDGEALLTWRDRSPAHAAALRDAMKLQRTFEAMASDQWPAVSKAAHGAQPSRRVVIGGTIAAGGAGFAVLAGLSQNGWLGVHPDFETGPGDRRNVVLADGSRLELGTKTQVSRLKNSQHDGVTLIAGELFVHTGTGRFSLVSAKGRAWADGAAFNVRRDGKSTCFTCVEGDVTISHPRGQAVVRAGQQLTYDDQHLGPAAATDVDSVTAWRQGLLIFRNVKLQRVITELNRYRANPILLADSGLADRTVYAVFRTNQAEIMVAQISRLSGARAVKLPGGVILLT